MTIPNQISNPLPPLGGESVPATTQEIPIADPTPVEETPLASTGVDDLIRDLSSVNESEVLPQVPDVGPPVVAPIQEAVPVAPINPDLVPVTPPVPVEPVAPPAPPTQAEVIAQLQQGQAAMMQQQTQSTQIQQQQMQQMQQQQAQAQQPDPNQAIYDAYNFQIPAQLSDAINNEDVGIRNQGLSALLTAVASQVDKNVTEKYTQALNQVPVYMQERMNYDQSIQAAKSDFYSTYPELNNPALADIIQTTANGIVPQMGGQWSPQVRDAIATEVKNKIQALTQVASPQPVGPVAQPPIVQTQVAQPQQFIAGGSPTHQMQPPVEDPNRIGNSPQAITDLFS